MAKASITDLSEFAEFGAPSGRKSPFDHIVDTLTGEQREKFDAAVASPTVTAIAIARWLKKAGHRPDLNENTGQQWVSRLRAKRGIA